MKTKGFALLRLSMVLWIVAIPALPIAALRAYFWKDQVAANVAALALLILAWPFILAVGDYVWNGNCLWTGNLFKQARTKGRANLK